MEKDKKDKHKGYRYKTSYQIEEIKLHNGKLNFK